MDLTRPCFGVAPLHLLDEGTVFYRYKPDELNGEVKINNGDPKTAVIYTTKTDY